jgi:hypothetical protein
VCVWIMDLLFEGGEGMIGGMEDERWLGCGRGWALRWDRDL